MSGVCPPTRTKSRSRSHDAFVLTLWTNDPELARRADAAGVDRIGVDLERLGKAERQNGLGTWISPHRLEDIDGVGAALSDAQLFARVNPLHAGSAGEVAGVLDRGVEVLMLPMVASPRDAREFTRMVDGAATVVLLLETGEAIRRAAEVVAVDGVDEVHVGINDLALSLGLPNRWLTLAGDVVVRVGEAARAAGKRFGLGAVGRAGDDGLPVPAGLVYAQYARTGATAALVSRSFFRGGDAIDLGAEIARVRSELAGWSRRSDEELAAAHEEFLRRAALTDGF